MRVNLGRYIQAVIIYNKIFGTSKFHLKTTIE